MANARSLGNAEHVLFLSAQRVQTPAEGYGEAARYGAQSVVVAHLPAVLNHVNRANRVRKEIIRPRQFIANGRRPTRPNPGSLDSARSARDALDSGQGRLRPLLQ